MLHLSLFSWSIWIAAIGLQPALALIMMRGGFWKRWPSLFALVLWLTVKSLALFAISQWMADSDLRPLLYFWVYWAAELIAELLEVWVIIQICIDLIGISAKLRRRIAMGVPVLSILSLSISIFLALQTSVPFYNTVMRTVNYMDRAVSLAWLCSFLVVVLGSEVLGIEWTTEGRLVAIGLSLDCMGSTLASWFGFLLPKAVTPFDLKGIIYLLALSAWAGIFTAKKSDPETLPSVEVLSAYVKTKIRAAQSIRGIHR